MILRRKRGFIYYKSNKVAGELNHECPAIALTD